MPATTALLLENEKEFLKHCHEDVLDEQPDALDWVESYCVNEWLRIENSAFMAEAILALAAMGDIVQSPAAVRARLQTVQWLANGTNGAMQDLDVYVPKSGSEIVFYWQQQGSEGAYNIIGALQIRGVALRTLGCPQYPWVSMGREKVMAGQLGDQPVFVLTVYSRPAPTGIEQSIYQVNADFSGTIPDMAALHSGHYPGGGGRAFAVDLTGWEQECSDP